jgi:hypothetical protein
MKRLHRHRATPRNSFRLASATLSRLIARRMIVARRDGVRMLVDVASLKAYYEA